MAKISRRNFMRGAAMGTMGAAAAGLLTACGNTASSTTSAPASSAASSEAASVVTKPSTPVDGKYVTKAMGHESWVHVATTFFEGKITACEVLSHEETIGIGNYACSRIPAAIVEHQSINVPNLRGSSITSMAVKAAVKEAIELAGYNVDDFSKEVTLETSNEVIEEEADVVIMGAGTSGLTCACRLLEAGYSVILVEKRDIPGGSMSMTYGGVATAGSQLQYNYDVDGSFRSSAMGTLEGMMNFWQTVAGDLVDWMAGIGIGFNTMGNYESATQYGASTPYLAPGCYEGGAGYAMMFMAQRVEKYEKGKIIYSTSVTDLIKDESGRVVGFHAKGDNGASYTLRGKAVCLASGGFAKNPEMLKKYNPDYADFFFNCASSMTGEGIQMGIDAGGYVECENRALPAFLSSYKSKFELAFIHQSAPGIMVNVRGDNIGNIISDNHYTMAKAKLNKDNGDTFYYVFDEASAVHYDSVEKASEELNLPNLADSIEANNAAALAGEPDEFGRRNCPYIETRDGLWAIRVDPTFYLTTAGLAIDTDCHVLNEEKKAIPGLYAAGDVCGSIEEKDAKQYGMGFDAALTYGYIMGETLKKEI